MNTDREIRKFGLIALIFFGALCVLGIWRQKVIPIYFFGFLMYDDTLKIKTKCRNWESHPGCRGHNAESCY